MIKIIFTCVAYWWAFFALAGVMLLAKTGCYSAVLSYIATYNGGFWWAFAIIGLAAGVVRLVISSGNIQ